MSFGCWPRFALHRRGRAEEGPAAGAEHAGKSQGRMFWMEAMGGGLDF